MNNEDLLYKKLNALRLEVDSSIVADILSTVADVFSQQNGAKPSVRSSAEVNKKVRHKAIDLLLEITSRWNESGVEIPQDYVTEVQRAIMNIRLD